MNYTKEAKDSRQRAVSSRQGVLISIVLLLLLAFAANAQISGKSIPELRREASIFRYLPILASAEVNPRIPFVHLFHLKAENPSQKPTMPILYSYEQLAFFCKIEVKLEKAVKLPIKFRLGDVEYVDRMEGKRQ